MNKFKTLVFVNLSIVTSAASIGFSPNAFALVTAANVNGAVITLDQLNQRFAEQLRSNGPSAESKNQVLDDMIKREVAVQEAKKMKLDLDPAVQDRIDSVLFFAYVDKKLGNEFERMGVSENEAKNWYEKNPEIRTSHVFIALPTTASKEETQRAEEKMEDIRNQIKSGKVSFAEAAQKYSEDPSGPMGGDLDYRTKDRLDINYYKAAVKLGKPGEMSGIVRTPFGLHLIRLTAKKSWAETDRTRIKRLILEEKREALVAKMLEGLKQRAKVSINHQALQ